MEANRDRHQSLASASLLVMSSNACRWCWRWQRWWRRQVSMSALMFDSTHISLWANQFGFYKFYFSRITSLKSENMTDRKEGERWEQAIETTRPAQCCGQRRRRWCCCCCSRTSTTDHHEVVWPTKSNQPVWMLCSRKHQSFFNEYLWHGFESSQSFSWSPSLGVAIENF